ncbi:hypothetical protein ACHAPT_009197 [Fusarium lateritium]
MCSPRDRLPHEAGFDNWDDLKAAVDKQTHEIAAELEAEREEMDAKFEAEMERELLEMGQRLGRRLAMKPVAEEKPRNEQVQLGIDGGGQRECPVLQGQKAQEEKERITQADQNTKPNGDDERDKAIDKQTNKIKKRTPTKRINKL